MEIKWGWIFWLLLALAILVGIVFFLPIPSHAQVPQITLDWIAPGDDGMVGTASTYQMRWSTARPDTTSMTTMDAWWAAATVVTGLPVPLISGTSQAMTVNGPFVTGTNYYFVMKACDEVPNCSIYSNVAVKFVPDTTPPSRIIDLRTR
jgi:hypothetical protein